MSKKKRMKSNAGFKFFQVELPSESHWPGRAVSIGDSELDKSHGHCKTEDDTERQLFVAPAPQTPRSEEWAWIECGRSTP